MVKSNKTRYLVLMPLIVVSAFSLTGCGGGGGGGSAASPDGIYSGVTTGGRGNPPGGNEKGIIYNNRMMVFATVFDIQQLYNSSLSINNTTINGTLEIYNNKTAPIIGTAELTGTFSEGVTVDLSFSNATDSNINDGTITLTPNASLFSKGSNQTTVVGSWQGTHGNLGNSTSLSIDSLGAISGNDTQGCNFTGTIIPADTSVNVYNITILSTGGAGCTSLPANTYTGLAWTEGTNNSTLNLTVSDGTYSRSVELTKI